ncbi:MAG: tyrosine-type recombinase/integrase [Solirubrobacterales bacterium]|nr:tyrosine-type recombinase/integrase [Solirubrobacterales bacterium]
MRELQLSLSPAAAEVELVDGELVTSIGPADLSPSPPPFPTALAERNLFAEAERIAARAATASTRRQYGAIFRAFGDWLAAALGRAPLVGDLDADVIAADGRQLAASGGRGGRPAAPATVRVYLSMVRALARELGLDDAAADARVPRHEPGPPETLTDTDYANLLRVPDRRTIGGKRDYALLRVLGDCGLRSAELRGLRARDLRRPRANARHYRLYVRGKGGREREVPVPEAVQEALEAWTAVHPLARGVGLLDEQPLFVRLGRHGDQEPLPLSAVAVHRLVRRSCLAAGVPERLAHPHALRAYWATHLLEAGVPVHEVSARLGHVDLRTTARYAAPRPERVDDIAEVLDRRHQAARRAGSGA